MRYSIYTADFSSLPILDCLAASFEVKILPASRNLMNIKGMMVLERRTLIDFWTRGQDPLIIHSENRGLPLELKNMVEMNLCSYYCTCHDNWQFFIKWVKFSKKWVLAAHCEYCRFWQFSSERFSYVVTSMLVEPRGRDHPCMWLPTWSQGCQMEWSSSVPWGSAAVGT